MLALLWLSAGCRSGGDNQPPRSATATSTAAPPTPTLIILHTPELPLASPVSAADIRATASAAGYDVTAAEPVQGSDGTPTSGFIQDDLTLALDPGSDGRWYSGPNFLTWRSDQSTPPAISAASHDGQHRATGQPVEQQAVRLGLWSPGCGDVTATQGNRALTATIWVLPRAAQPDIGALLAEHGAGTLYPIPAACQSTTLDGPLPSINAQTFGQLIFWVAGRGLRLTGTLDRL